MEYWVEVHGNVERFLEARLSPPDAEHLLRQIVRHLARGGDVYRNNASLRMAPESYSFQVDYLFLDSDGNLRLFSFVVNDEHAETGVLRILYVDEQ